MSKRTCDNTSCVMRGKQVETDRSTCLSCGRPFKASSGLLGDLGGLFDDLLGTSHRETTERSTASDEMLVALREAETILSSFLSGTAVKRKELDAAHSKIVIVLRRFG